MSAAFEIRPSDIADDGSLRIPDQWSPWARPGQIVETYGEGRRRWLVNLDARTATPVDGR